MNKDLSIIIVSYNSRQCIVPCIDSIFQNLPSCDYEIIIVDNNSGDGTIEMVREIFPEVHLIKNNYNAGFAKSNNQAINLAKGKYILLLNPDTIVLESSIDNMFSFMEKNNEVGIVGPMIINADGTFQPQCKRGFPTPSSVFSYFLGLHKIFPKNKTFGKYLLTYLDQNELNEIDSVSGACMFVRRQVFKEVGLLDEDYFMFGEDLDLCFRAKQEGWKVCYLPASKIVHFGGHGGTSSRPFKTTYDFFKSAYIFYKKNLSHKYHFLFNFIIYFGIWLLFALIFLRNFVFRKRYVFTKKSS